MADSPSPTWGNLLQEAQTLDVILGKPWRWITPGLVIATCIFLINFIGDGLRDELDPRDAVVGGGEHGVERY